MCWLIVLLTVASAGFSFGTAESAGHTAVDDTIIVETESYSFSAVEKGNPSDDAVILLHGFPETSYMWDGLQVGACQKRVLHPCA